MSRAAHRRRAFGLPESPATSDLGTVETLDGQVLIALATVAKGLAVVFAMYCVLNVAVEWAHNLTLWMVVGDAATAAFFCGLCIAITRRRVRPRWANPLAFSAVAVLLTHVLVDFWLTREPIYLSYLVILVAGASALLLSVRWFLAALALVWLATAPVAWRLVPFEDLSHYGLPALAASGVAVVIFAARRRSGSRTKAALLDAREEALRRRQAEEALREGEKRLELAIAGSQGGWWDIEMDPENPEVVPDSINLDPVIKGFIGFTDEEFPNSVRKMWDRIVPEDREIHSAAVAHHVAGKTPLYEVEIRVRHKNGGIRWICSRGRIQRDAQGRPVRWSGIDWDITDSKQAESRLHLLNRAVEQSPSLVLITGTDGSIEYVNTKFTSSTGYALQEVLGKKPSLLKSEETPPEVHGDIWRTITAGREWQGELKNRRKDGSGYWVNAAISPIKDGDGFTRHYLSLQEDITERRKVEAQLARAQNLESVGLLVSGVAHDFNNLLTAVIGFAELALRREPEGTPLHRELTEIKKAGDAGGELTRRLLAFSRQQVLSPEVLNLNDVVSHLESLLRRTIRENVELEFDLAPDLGAVKVDPSQMNQVLVNLAVNARDAMPEGGKLTIESHNVDFDGSNVFGSAVPEAGRYVQLAVSDTGHGIDEEVKGRVFEPFFTTKPRGHGTGLGLASVYGAVKQSGGYISLYSEVGVGTSFKIYFPHVQDELETGKASKKAPVRGGRETILVVEDDIGVRKIATRTLRARGYRVFSCGEATEAIRLFSRQQVDLLLTDVVMPGLNGAGLARELQTRKPDLRVLLMSGYTERSVLDAQRLDPSTPFLNKPFSLDDLLAKVRGCLEGTL